MSTIIQKTATNIKIGELLVQAGMLSQIQLAEAVRHAGGKRLQLGQILVMYGYLKASDLQAALDAQSMIRDRTIDLNLAVKCLKIVYKTGISFVAALAEQEGHGITKAPTGKLGELLLEAGVITTDEFAKALQRSLTTGLPLGRMLVLNQVMAEDQLNQALEIQVRLRDHMINREEAILALQITARPGFGIGPLDEKQVPTSAPHTVPRRRGVRLGELMVLAGVITETDVMHALEIGLLNHKPIGEVLVSKGLVTQQIIDAALELQRRIDDLTLTVVQASECLARIRSTSCSIDEAIANLKEDLNPGKMLIGYEKLLTLAKVVTEEDIESAFDLSSKSAQIVGRVLLITGFIDEPTMQATLRCHQLLSRGWITQDDAIASLHYCLRQKDESRQINFDDALKELGWQANKPLTLEDEDHSAGITTGDLVAASNIVEQTESPSNERDVAPEKKSGKHVETISPEDPNARKIAMLVKAQAGGDKQASGFGVLTKSLAESFSQLAMSYYEEGNYVESQLLYERILVHRLKKLGPDHIELVSDLRNLAGVLCAQGKFNQAEAFMRRVVSISEMQKDVNVSELSDALSILGGIYFQQGKYAEAEIPFAKSLKFRRGILAIQHPDLVESVIDYARVMKKLGRTAEAEKLYEEAKTNGNMPLG